MIEITNLIWLDESIEKIETKHDVTPAEVAEVLESSPKIKRMSKGHFRGEHVYRALGQTEEGRYLAVFFIYKRTHEALVLSARDMDEKVMAENKAQATQRDELPENFDSIEAFWSFWDTHSTADYEDLMEDVEVRFNLESSQIYCAVSKGDGSPSG